MKKFDTNLKLSNYYLFRFFYNDFYDTSKSWCKDNSTKEVRYSIQKSGYDWRSGNALIFTLTKEVFVKGKWTILDRFEKQNQVKLLVADNYRGFEVSVLNHKKQVAAFSVHKESVEKTHEVVIAQLNQTAQQKQTNKELALQYVNLKLADA